MNKKTAGKLLAILNDHGDYELDSGANHRVGIYLAAVELLAFLEDAVVISVETAKAMREEDDDDDDGAGQELRAASRSLEDAVEIARLLSEVRS